MSVSCGILSGSRGIRVPSRTGALSRAEVLHGKSGRTSSSAGRSGCRAIGQRPRPPRKGRNAARRSPATGAASRQSRSHHRYNRLHSALPRAGSTPRCRADRTKDLVVHNYGHGGSGWSLSWGSSAPSPLRKRWPPASVTSRWSAVVALGLTSALLLQGALAPG